MTGAGSSQLGTAAGGSDRKARTRLLRPSRASGGARRTRYLALLVVLLAGLLVVGSVGSWSLYLSVRDEMDRQLGVRLLAIATTAAQGIGGERFEQLSANGPGSPVYDRVRAELERTADANDLDEIVLVDAERITVLDLRGQVPAGVRHPILDLQPELRTTLLSGLPQATRLVEVEGLSGEYLKTGFAAVEDSTGKILGALVVEGGSDFFSVLPSMRRKILWSAGSALAGVLVLGFFAFRILRSLIRYEESLRQAAALAAIGQISSIVAHEIKNPLAIIRSRAERVRAKIQAGKDPEEVLEWFEAIPAEVDRLDGILTSYLSLARPDQEGEGACLLAAVVEETLRLLGPEAKKRQIAVDTSFEDAAGMWVAMGSRSLKQVFLNLALNAFQAMEGGGRLTLRTRRAHPRIALEVEDTGPGMGEAEMRRALEPFFTTKPTGSGLGLTLVDSLVQARGGQLEIHSVLGQGTRVTVWLLESEASYESKG